MQIPGCFVPNEREAGSFESNCSGGQVFLFGFLGFNLKSAPRFFQSEVTKKHTFLHLGRRSKRSALFLKSSLRFLQSYVTEPFPPRAPSCVRTPRPPPLPPLVEGPLLLPRYQPAPNTVQAGRRRGRGVEEGGER